MENSDQKPPIVVEGPDDDGAYTIDVAIDLGTAIDLGMSPEEAERLERIANADSDWEALKAAQIKLRDIPELIWVGGEYVWYNYMRPWLRRKVFRR
jgi:hypothetical protein